MTRQENSGSRDLIFSGWLRKSGKVKSSEDGLSVTDLDFCLHSWKSKPRKLMLIEMKQHGAKIRFPQRQIYVALNKALKIGLKQIGYDFLGIHVITFENRFFNDGKCFLDNKEITEDELGKFLSL